jgi:hypothetical protein
MQLRSLGLAFIAAIVLVSLGVFNDALASSLIIPHNNTGLVGYWDMNEGTGTSVFDRSGAGKTGTLVNGAAWVDGKFGKAVSFDGSNDYIDLSTVSAQVIPITFSFWAKPATASPVGILDTAPSVANPLRNWPAGSIEWYNANPSVSLNLTANEWAHLSFVYTHDGNRHLAYYKNGVLQANATGDTDTSLAWTTFTLGNINGGAAGSYSGLLDDFRIYSRALSANEISRMYQQGVAKRASVNTTGLVGWWRFNEGSGTLARDDSGKGNNGTLTSGPTWTTGKFGNGLSFDGVDDYVAIGNPASLQISGAGSAVTLSSWVYVASRPAAGDYAIIGKGYESANQNEWRMTMLGQASADPVVFFRTVAATGRSHKTNSTLPLGQWVHVVSTCLYGDSAPKIYFNGVEQALTLDDGTASTYNFPSSSNDVSIGRDSNNSSRFNGRIDDVRVYNRALSATEVATLYGDTSAGRLTKISTTDKTGVSSGLIGHWTFDGPEITTSTSTDASGQGKNGTITGTFTAAAGRLGQAFRFNGVNTYIDANDLAMSNFANGFTWSMWIKTSSFNGTWGWPISASQGAGVYSYFQCGKIANTGNVRFDTGNFTSNTNLDTTGKNIADGAWHHLVCMWNRSAAVKYIYIDNVLAASTGASVNNTALDYGHLRLGAHQGPDEHWNGILDDVRVYNRPLNTPEINLLYKMGR